jgi:hypothetical protein
VSRSLASRSLTIAFALGATLAVASPRAGDAASGSTACPQPAVPAAASARVMSALRAGADVWGNALLASRSGPTYAGARRFLPPLLFAGGRGKTKLTESGVYYLPFSQPLGPHGAGSVALHVADGGQIVSDRIGARELTISVGRRGGERYGSCLARLTQPTLASGYLPILQTRYVDGAGARYRQESFAAHVAATASLVSFVRLDVDARVARSAVQVRFRLSAEGLSHSGNRLVRGGAVHLVAGDGGRLEGASVVYRVARGDVRTVLVAFVNYPRAGRPFTLDETSYDEERRSVAAYWEDRLAQGASIVVPEGRVNDAIRGLLVQNLALTWRYSIGNSYEQFSFPEGVDVAQVMAEWGFGPVARAMLRSSLQRKPTPYPNWKMGEKLIGSALYYRLYRDGDYIDAVTPRLRSYVQILGRQIAGGGRGLLGRERYSSDIPDSVYGLHSQAVAWQGLREMGAVWGDTGRRALAERCAGLAARLGVALRRAVRSSARRLEDGSLFVPVRLLDGEEPYDDLTASRAGSYWNLVMPYALASGLFRPGGAETTGVLRYMLRHGSRLLGLVRVGAYALYRDPVFPTSGTDQVYGINVARFLADNDEADQLVLSLYGTLAAALTPRTFVAGEAASVAPLGGSPFRSMYLPPNGAANAAFLATLRALLAHETRDGAGRPFGLRLAFATPRAWLSTGKRIVVERLPTGFGPVSFTLEAHARSVDVALELPPRRPRRIELRLRLPSGKRLTAVTLDGRPVAFRADTGTIDLTGRSGQLALVARVGRTA